MSLYKKKYSSAILNDNSNDSFFSSFSNSISSEKIENPRKNINLSLDHFQKIQRNLNEFSNNLFSAYQQEAQTQQEAQSRSENHTQNLS